MNELLSGGTYLEGCMSLLQNILSDLMQVFVSHTIPAAAVVV